MRWSRASRSRSSGPDSPSRGGFELFLLDGSKGDRLWTLVKEAGAPFGIGPGYPNPSERTENGLLNWDIDTDDATNPFEVRMDLFVDLDVPDNVIGVKALRRIKAEGVKRHQLGIMLDVQEAPGEYSGWLAIERDGMADGHMRHHAWSYRFGQWIGYALVSVSAQPGDKVAVRTAGRTMSGTLAPLPFHK